MVRVRFAPSPTGSLHLGGALTAVANRRFADERGGAMALRIDDTDAARVEAGAEAAILRDLEWLGVGWEEGPFRQSERVERYQAAAHRLLEAGAAFEEAGSVRFREERRPTLLRADGTPTYHLASVVDDIELGSRTSSAARTTSRNASSIVRSPGRSAPSRRSTSTTGCSSAPTARSSRSATVRRQLATYASEGIPAEAVRAYLEELDLPRRRPPRSQRASRGFRWTRSRLSDEELAGRAGAPLRLAPALRGARTLAEARGWAQQIHDEPPAPRARRTGARHARALPRAAGGSRRRA